MDKSHQAIFTLLTYFYNAAFDGEFTQEGNKLLTDYASNFIETEESDELANIQSEEISQIIDDAASDYRKAILNIPVDIPEFPEWDIMTALVTKVAPLIKQKSYRRLALTMLIKKSFLGLCVLQPMWGDHVHFSLIEIIHGEWVDMNDGWTEQDFQECLDRT